MTLYTHELKQGRRTFLLWTTAIAAFMAMCVFLFPEMREQMDDFGQMFAAMGTFTAAFGMDKLNFGTFLGFYGVECGNILSVGGAFFAAVISVNALSREEKEHTAEFLLAHPLNRGRMQRCKLASVITQLLAMNLLVFGLILLSVKAIGEPIAWKELSLLHLAYFLCQLELALLCYAISAFSRGNNYGVGLGLTLVLYFMSLLANVSDKMKVFHVLSPFGYAEGSDILTACALDGKLIALGMAIGLGCAAVGYLHYMKKDVY